MKSYNLIINSLIATGIALASVNTSAVTVTVDGVSYSVTASALVNYDVISSTLQSSPVWGDAALAQALATATGINAGTANDYGPSGASPAFVYGTSLSGTLIPLVNSYVWAPVIGLNQVSWVREDNPVYWAIVSLLGPSAADTFLSINSNAFALRNSFNLQSAKTAQGLSYDCTVFDKNNICVSFAGTRSNGDDGLDNTTGALIIAHRPTANIRVGAYVDQTMGTTDSNGLKVKHGSPGYGVFGVWSQRTDGLGTQVRVAANAGKVDVESTRLAIETAEAGFGQSNIKSNGIQLEVSQGYALNNQWTTRPYVGYRQMTNKRAAYTEQTSDSVQNPLAYTGLKQTTESILAGVRFIGKLTQQTSLNLSAGIERDVKSTVDNYQASFVGGEAIDPINMTQNIKKTRPTASVGLVHSLDKTQTVGLFVTHRKEALQSGSTTSGMLQYSVGF